MQQRLKLGHRSIPIRRYKRPLTNETKAAHRRLNNTQEVAQDSQNAQASVLQISVPNVSCPSLTRRLKPKLRIQTRDPYSVADKPV